MSKKNRQDITVFQSEQDGAVAVTSQENTKTSRLSAVITIAVFIVFIFGIAAATVISKDRKFSEMENRNLAQQPEFSFKNLKEGKFTEELESYISDQLFLKDTFVSLKTDCDRAAFKSYQNGIYFSDNGYILQQYTENRAQIDENIGCINDFADKLSVPVDFILAPNSISVNSDLLPFGALNDDQRKSIEHIEKILSNNVHLYSTDSAQYYKTDHHWTSEAAKTAFEEYFKGSGQQLVPISYEVEKIKDFYGTLYSKAPSGFIKPDELHLYTNPNGKYSVEYVKENKTSDSLYDRSFIDKKDKYSTFFGGNFSQIRIKTNASSGQKVLVLKDSYANAMMPFLADQYSEITMIDLRYFHFEANTVSELCELYGVDRVILIYNMDFINSDRNFIWLE